MRDKKFASGEWKPFRMVHAERGDVMTPEEIGEYVKNAVIKSAEESGTMDYSFVCCTKENGDYDVCHTGNGPTSKHNAHLIAAAPELLDLLEVIVDEINNGDMSGTGLPWHIKASAAIAKAYGETE